jgi:hypothetical protein
VGCQRITGVGRKLGDRLEIIQIQFFGSILVNSQVFVGHTIVRWDDPWSEFYTLQGGTEISPAIASNRTLPSTNEGVLKPSILESIPRPGIAFWESCSVYWGQWRN